MTGGKQYQVDVGSVIEVERLPQEVGNEVAFDQVLMLSTGEATNVGRPVLEGVAVTGEVLEHFRGDKVTTFKHKRRKNYRKTIGHRQELTRVRIKAIAS
jgi:large subunit ribosomal protein L21